MFGSDIQIVKFRLTKLFYQRPGTYSYTTSLQYFTIFKNFQQNIFSPVLAERLQLDSTKNSVSEIEVPEVKPAIFQQIIGKYYLCNFGAWETFIR